MSLPDTMPGPVHKKVEVALEDTAWSVALGSAQVRVAPVAETTGALRFSVTVATPVEEQPFIGSCTVTLYSPGLLMSGDAVSAPETRPGPDQVNLEPVAEDEAER